MNMNMAVAQNLAAAQKLAAASFGAIATVSFKVLQVINSD